MSDVFISYQRQSEAAARQLYEKLADAGFTVWQDVHNIRNTARWSVEIDRALRETERLILLLTPDSMKSEEVFNEWFFFYSQKKPLHCLMVEKCQPHYQLVPFQYLPWHDPQPADWERLIRELKAEFMWPSLAGAEVVVNSPHAPQRTLPEAMDALLKVVREEGSLALTDEQVDAIAKQSPSDLTQYRLGRIAEWSKPRYQLDNRFVQLTMLIDQGEDAQGVRWQEARRFTDLREVLAAVPEPALVLLGAPGSGKSTLLRRYQLDDAIDRLRDHGELVTFFIQLNQYRAPSPDAPLPAPLDWLKMRWTERYPHLPPLLDLIRAGRVLFLLDALNEMPQRDPTDYREKVSLWKHFLHETIRDHPGNRAVFSCRSLDYSAPLSSPDLRVPQVRIEPMSDDQVQQFLNVYIPARAEAIWQNLKHHPAQLDLFRTPYFLKLLVDQVETEQEIPKGRAALFAGFVRGALKREIERENRLFYLDTLLTERDHQRLVTGKWRTPYDLPERGVLLPRLAVLAYQMQARGIQNESAQVRIDVDDACRLLQHERDEDILKAGTALNVLDEDTAAMEILFFHQLLQEFFAARQLAQHPDPALVAAAWQVDQVQPSLAETLAKLADSDPLPPLPTTGWEETTILAAAMTETPDDFVRAIMAVNLPLAGRCAAAPEVKISDGLKAEIQQALITRTQDKTADLRARIEAGLRLGELGDPRFERRTGAFGDYLLSPLIPIPAGEYPIGADDSSYADERPRHTVKLEAFQIGQFPVTNAEYALFMAAGGYEDERWWDTEAALAWLRGESSTEGQKTSERDFRAKLQNVTEDYIRDLVKQNRITSKQAGDWIIIRNWSNEEFENWLDEIYPSGKIYREPGYWNDLAYNNPNQPVVGICWHEARAYCNWLAAQTGQGFRLPREVEIEATARGFEGRIHAYGNTFDSALGNTFESHIRHTTPIGVFPGGETPEGVVDLCGNTWDWTSSVFEPYPYDPADGREDENRTDVPRTLRGGSWNYFRDFARAAFRFDDDPVARYYGVGFRVVVSSPFSPH
ncbi:MAG: SUMF1/EgtB/PvdO family nonheme iron enzyme [Anaerolineae bacterium]|nr:SUMF1/EgtB/PvdO family nonheme iron enzyme [Anaerolineae bacterium]